MAQLIKREIMLNSLSIKQKLTWLIACAGLALGRSRLDSETVIVT